MAWFKDKFAELCGHFHKELASVNSIWFEEIEISKGQNKMPFILQYKALIRAFAMRVLRLRMFELI
jgi:hypothetical protein